MVAWNVQWNLLKHQLLLISHTNSCNACTLTFSLNILTERFHGRWHDSKPQKKCQWHLLCVFVSVVIMCEVHDSIFFCIFQLFKAHGEMLILETAPGQACVALTLLPFWFWQCDSCNRALGLKEQVQKCACVWTWIQIKAWTLMFHCLCRFYSSEFTERRKEQKGWRTERW